jgi:hypothetical protein
VHNGGDVATLFSLTRQEVTAAIKQVMSDDASAADTCDRLFALVEADNMHFT